MRLTFLGTGTSVGIPVIGCHCRVCRSADRRDQRLRTSVLIEERGIKVLIDCGPDFRQQMLREKVDSLDAILFTHAHKDHTGGLDDVRPLNEKRGGPLPVYGEKRVLEALEAQYPYIFSKHDYPGLPSIETHCIRAGSGFSVRGLKILPVRAMHHRLPVLAFRLGGLSYITDAKQVDKESLSLMRGSRVLIVNALRKKAHPTHFNLSEALELIDELKPQRAFLVHMSHGMGRHEDLMKELPEGVMPAFDRLSIVI